jgi:hypothetical protein
VPDSNTFHIGGVSGGQNNFGGDHNAFQQVNHAADPAVAELLTRLRGRLEDFENPPAAAQALESVAQDPRSSRGREALRELAAWVKPGTEALAALTALTAALRGLLG